MTIRPTSPVRLTPAKAAKPLVVAQAAAPATAARRPVKPEAPIQAQGAVKTGGLIAGAAIGTVGVGALLSVVSYMMPMAGVTMPLTWLIGGTLLGGAAGAGLGGGAGAIAEWIGSKLFG
ncbi:MAG: hypothetical protein ACK46X_04705 [Candidatus Sericytochromatia bacterium]